MQGLQSNDTTHIIVDVVPSLLHSLRARGRERGRVVVRWEGEGGGGRVATLSLLGGGRARLRHEMREGERGCASS